MVTRQASWFFRSVIAIALLAGTLTAAHASSATTRDVTEVGGETLINTTTAHDQKWPAIARLMNRRHVVVWQSDKQDGDGFGVYGKMFTSGFNAGSAEFRVNKTTELNQYAPAVGALNDGGFVVVWEGEATHGKRTEIYARRYGSNAKPWTKSPGEFVVNSNSVERQQAPSVSGLADGGFVVVWHSYVAGHVGATGVYGRIYNKNGEAAGPQFVVSPVGNRVYKSYPKVAGLPHGGFIVAWELRDGEGAASAIVAQRYNAHGGKAGSEFQATSSGAPEVAALADGSFIITWPMTCLDDPPNGCFYGQLFTGTAKPKGATFRINTTAEVGAGAVSGFGTDGFIALWEQYDQGNPDGIVGRAFDSSGDPVDVEFRVTSPPHKQKAAPAVAAFDSGRAIAVWMSKNQDGSGIGIYGQELIVPGVP